MGASVADDATRSKAKFTLGPWVNENGLVTGRDTARPQYRSFDIYDAAEWPGDEAEAQANASLIGAALRLLQALRALLRQNSVNTLEEAAREYPHGKEDVADVLAVFDEAHAAIRAAEAAE